MKNNENQKKSDFNRNSPLWGAPIASNMALFGVLCWGHVVAGKVVRPPASSRLEQKTQNRLSRTKASPQARAEKSILPLVPKRLPY